MPTSLVMNPARSELVWIRSQPMRFDLNSSAFTSIPPRNDGPVRPRLMRRGASWDVMSSTWDTRALSFLAIESPSPTRQSFEWPPRSSVLEDEHLGPIIRPLEIARLGSQEAVAEVIHLDTSIGSTEFDDDVNLGQKVSNDERIQNHSTCGLVGPDNYTSPVTWYARETDPEQDDWITISSSASQHSSQAFICPSTNDTSFIDMSETLVRQPTDDDHGGQEQVDRIPDEV